jgi:hypothetical protein
MCLHCCVETGLVLLTGGMHATPGATRTTWRDVHVVRVAPGVMRGVMSGVMRGVMPGDS